MFKEIKANNVKTIKKNLNGCKFRLTKNGLFIYGKYTTYYISNYDLEQRGQDSAYYNNMLLSAIIDTESRNGVLV